MSGVSVIFPYPTGWSNLEGDGLQQQSGFSPASQEEKSDNAGGTCSQWTVETVGVVSVHTWITISKERFECFEAVLRAKGGPIQYYYRLPDKVLSWYTSVNVNMYKRRLFFSS